MKWMIGECEKRIPSKTMYIKRECNYMPILSGNNASDEMIERETCMSGDTTDYE